MSAPRFSLRWLFGSITFLAIGCGLLVYARPVTAYLTFAATLLGIFSTIPLSVYRSGATRAFWFGFALFGLGYLGVICGPWLAPGVHIQVGVRERLPTTKLLEFAYAHLPTKPVTAPVSSPTGGAGFFGQMGGMGGITGPMGGGGSMPPARYPIADWTDFAVIGHSLWAIVIAILGGGIASWCERTGRRPT